MSRRLVFPAVLSTAAAILILAAGCADQTPTAVQLEPGAVSASLALGQTANVVKAAEKYQAGTYAQVIGHDGGTLDFGVGKIEFPAGAVARATRITASVDGENFLVDFSPNGLEFPSHAQPIITFAHMVAVDASSDLLIYHYDDFGAFIEAIAPTVSVHEARIWAAIPGFSQYALVKP